MTAPALLKESASQTAGPYVHIGLMPSFAGIGGVYPADLGGVMTSEQTIGTRIGLDIRVLDGLGEPVMDAVVEIWQADHAGLYPSPYDKRGKADPHFTGWGRQAADPHTGAFSFQTIKPGRVPFSDGRLMAPHISVWIIARGINIGLHTRLYFEDEAEANAADPVLARVAPPVRRSTLIARRQSDGYAFNIHLQGDNETVFFDI